MTDGDEPTIEFRDARGQRGVITDSLDAAYDGRWADAVETWLADGARELAEDHDDRVAGNLLLLELPGVVPVESVRRVDGTRSDRSPEE